jgi:hypothetical protein
MVGASQEHFGPHDTRKVAHTMNTTRIQIAAAAALLAAAPVAASAAQTAYAVAPVTIQSVDDKQNYFTLPYSPQLRYLDGLSVTLVNHGDVAAKDVTFAVTRDGRTENIAKSGSYAPGTPIAVELANGTSILPVADAKIAIAKVDFADGSTWTPATGLVASR